MRLRNTSLYLVGICFLVFILQVAIGSLTPNLALAKTLLASKPWTFLTHMFAHGSVSHLLYNMFALALFGFILERIIGSEKFLILFFASGFAASIAIMIFYNSALGASGAIFGVLGTLTVLRPKMTVWAFGFPMPMALAAAFWAIGDLIGMFVPTGTANAAHLAGLAFGLAFGFYLRKKYALHGQKKDDIRIDEDDFERWERDWM